MGVMLSSARFRALVKYCARSTMVCSTTVPCGHTMPQTGMTSVRIPARSAKGTGFSSDLRSEILKVFKKFLFCNRKVSILSERYKNNAENVIKNAKTI